MRKQLKHVIAFGLVLGLSVLSSLVAFADEGKVEGWFQENGAWKYHSGQSFTIMDENSLLSDDWYWIDSNYDGIYECYYFEGDTCAMNTTIQGYTLNESGAWIKDSVVQTKKLYSMKTAEDTDYSRFVYKPCTGIIQDNYFVRVSPWYTEKIVTGADLIAEYGDDALSKEEEWTLAGRVNAIQDKRLWYEAVEKMMQNPK